MIGNCYQKAGFCKTSQPHTADDRSPWVLKDVHEKTNVTFISEDYVEADDNLLPCVVQEIDGLCTDNNNTGTDNEEEEAAACKPFPKCSEAMRCLDTYHHFLRGIPDLPESIIRNLWVVENCT
jgi:hypothetical protein